MDELLAYTGKSFCNLIRPDEQENCQKAYGRRLTEDTQMIIFLSYEKADGTYISVLDHDRIVDSVHNGRVFYVMIMDLKSLQRHYGDCLELVESRKSRLWTYEFTICFLIVHTQFIYPNKSHFHRIRCT